MSASSPPSALSEKETQPGSPPELAASSKKASFFTRLLARQKAADVGDALATGEATVDTKDEGAPPPVSFFDLLFRFSTKTEMAMNGIGLIAAAAAGTAQPLMTLLFGSLTQGFITFGTAIARAESGNPADVQMVPQAAAALRKDAAKNASYLTFVGVGVLVCNVIFMYSWSYTGEVNAKRLRERYLQATLRQDIAYFDDVGAGEVTTRIENDTHLVQQATSEKVPLSMTYIGAFFAGFILAYVRSWRLALALTSIFVWISGTGAIMMKFMTKLSTASTQHISDGGSLAEEVISSIRTAQAFGTQHTLALKYQEHVMQARQADFGSALYQGAGIGSIFFVIFSSYSLVFSFGTTLINKGIEDAGSVISVGMAMLIGSFSLALLAPEIQIITKGQGAAAKLYATIDRVPPIDSADPGGLKPEHVTGDIVLENINFVYPSRPTVQVLKDFSITFPAGKTAALVGASGSGKSTIVALIERFYDPGEGVVKLDGVDIRDLNIKWLRSQIGLVMQEPVLFSTSVRENVAHGLINTQWEHASEEKKFSLIKEACIKANADGFVSKLPQGYDTVVGERGLLLSGGQKQRVAIARAIVSDPRILLLDEATSALDTESEGVVQDALDKAAAGRTTITIAHRLSTIKDASQIFVMGEGTIVEHGTHDELLRNEDSVYTRLVRAQKLREDQPDSQSSQSVSKDDPVEEGPDDKVLGRRETFGSENLARAAMDHSAEGKKANYSYLYLFRRMGRLNRDVWVYYLLGGIFAIMSGFTHPAFAVVWARSLNGFGAITNEERRRAGDRNALWIFIISLLSATAIGMQNYTLTKASANLACKLRSLSFKAVLRQDIKFFDKTENSTGAITSNLNSNPTKTSGLAGVSLGAIVQSFVTLSTGFGVGLGFAWKIALVGIACTPMAASAGLVHLRLVVHKDSSNKSAHEESARVACEAAGSIRTVAALTREDHCCDLYRKSLEQPLKRGIRTGLKSAFLYGLAQATTYFIISLVFWYGSRLVSVLEYTPFQFFVGVMAVVFGSFQAGNVFAFVPDISAARTAASEVITLLDSIPEIDAESASGKSLTGVTGKLHLEAVHFRYPSRPEIPVLRGLSLTVEPGTFIALAGASGSGKSTVIQMIERFYDPLSGQLYLDDENITDLNVQDYRKHLALVSQEPTLYAGTVRFNVLLGAVKPAEEISQEEIEMACRDANILEFIQSLPNGFDTEVGGKGSQLSGGQKQRIAIARALLRNPRVLLLDEATSALDSSSEKVVQDALDKAAKGRTTVAIAHRLSTIQNADCIYFIKDGKISESGTHEQLLSLRGNYYDYCQLQALHGK